MKKVLVSSVFALFMAGCGTAVAQSSASSSSGSPGVRPPTAVIIIGHRHVRPVINGYAWSNGHVGSVADAAVGPAKHLKIYRASAGQIVGVSFSRTPSRVRLTLWANGTLVSKSPVAGSSITLPTHAGRYTYEVTGYWEYHRYAHFDFEVDVR